MAGHTGVIVKVAEPAQEFASVAVMVKVRLMELVGVPVTAPVVELRLKPTGSVPLLASRSARYAGEGASDAGELAFVEGFGAGAGHGGWIVLRRN